VEGQFLHVGGDAFTGFGAETQYFDTGLVYALCEHVHDYVGGCADQHLSFGLFDKVEDDAGAGNGLACAWRALDQTERFDQCPSDCFLLVEVEFGQSWGLQIFWYFDIEVGFGPGLSEDGVVEEAGDGGVVVLELLESLLHAVVGGGFPDELHLVGVVFFGGGFVVEQFQADLLI
jgi:hypothetical protein